MNTTFVRNGSGKQLPPGPWYGAVSASFIKNEPWITEWVFDMYRSGGIDDCMNYANNGRMYFRREQDLTLFLLRWS